eukprot:3941161-Rhodomonas_salina.2
METAPRLGAFLAARQYAFGSLQEAKYASMMLVYHLDQVPMDVQYRGTEIAMVLRACYAMCGTELAYGAVGNGGKCSAGRESGEGEGGGQESRGGGGGGGGGGGRGWARGMEARSRVRDVSRGGRGERGGAGE